MIEGMTGFGRAQAGSGLYHWTVEIRSLNSRFFDFSIRLPNTFSVLESDIQKIIQPKLKRGKVTVSASLTNDKSPAAERLVLDHAKMDFYVKTLKKAAKRYGLTGVIGVRELISLPNLFTVEKKDNSELYWKPLKAAVEDAFKKLLQMRVAEGRSLAKDLTMRAQKIKSSLAVIEKVIPKSIEDYRAQFEKKINELANNVKLDPERVAIEVAIQAERADITEEIVRAKHHLDSLLGTIQTGGEAGKKLEFIAQEIHREVNTIASKAQDFRISDEAVRMKSELEKIREQIQNIV